MIRIDIPGPEPLRIEHLVLDFNGTLALDGVLLDGVADRIRMLAEQVTVHVVTADTFGSARKSVDGLPLTLVILEPGNQPEAKRAVVRTLGALRTVAIGNGRNDVPMLTDAALGIAVLLQEGASATALQAADVACRRIEDALDLLIHHDRLVATLRA